MSEQSPISATAEPGESPLDSSFPKIKGQRLKDSGGKVVSHSFLEGPRQRNLFMPGRFWSNNTKFQRYKSSGSVRRGGRGGDEIFWS